MRLDQFLKTSLIFKTRSSAEKAIDQGHVLLNNKTSKPASPVNNGDQLTVTFPFKKIRYEVLCLPEEKNITRQKAKELIKILGEEKIEF